MSSYREMAEKAMGSGSAKQLSARQSKLKVGEELIGAYRGRDFLKSKNRRMPDFYRYHFEDDSGPVDLLFTAAFDKGPGASLREGKVYYIKLSEQRELSRGRRFNDYTVILVNPEEGDEDSDVIAESPDTE